MADTIFDSRKLYEQLVGTNTLSVVTSGTVPATTQKVWTSGWVTMHQKGATIRAEVYIPGSIYIPNVTNGRFTVPLQALYNNTNFLTCYPKIEVSGDQYRATVDVFNSYTYSVSSPNRTFTFYTREFVPPII